MKSIWIIFKRETAATFDSPIAYIFSIVFLLLTCGIFMNEFFLISFAEMDRYFDILPAVLIVFAPTLSMRLWAEDKKNNTYELLMTLPVRKADLIAGKFLSSFFVFAVVMAGTLPLVVMLYVLGQPDGGKIATSYLGSFFLAGFVLSMGLFISSLTRDQIVAYLLTLLAAAFFFLTGHEKFAAVTDGLWPALHLGSFLRDHVSSLPKYESFTRGLLDLKDVFYFLLMSFSFLFMNHLFMQKDQR
jgi:ABC-2 type transport system permease protein